MKRLVIISVTIALTLIPLFAHASAGMARLTLTQGDVLLFDNESNDWVPAAVNTPIEEGDRIWCPEAAKAEIQLKSGSVIRLGSKSAIDIVRLNDDEQQVYLDSGRLYARTAPDDRDLQIDTEDATVSLGRKSRVHVDILEGENPDTEVSVLKGSAYVEGSSGKTRVRSGEDLIFSENGAEIAQLNPPDKWELWNADRDRKSSRKAANHYLPEELMIYEDELAANGEWVQVEDYGYAWRPTVVAEADWVPYQQGRWVWRRGGYVWIASEPWGWAPHHYGRWYHSTRYGWCWVPPRRGDVYWSPGYVAWVDTQRDLAWVPLAPGETYYGYGSFGSLSINITSVDRRSVVRPIVNYRNTRVRNAVTVIERSAFATGRGKPRQGRPVGFERYQGLTAPPQIRPIAREARMPEVRRVTAGSTPPPAILRSHPAPLKDRFPHLERDRRGISPDRQPQAVRDRQKAPDNRQQPVQQRVAPTPQAQPARGIPAPQTPSRVTPAPQAQQPARVTPAPAPPQKPDKDHATQDRRQREAVQPIERPTPATAEKGVRPQGKPAPSEGRPEGRAVVRERQPQAEQKPAATPAVLPDARAKQPRRVWQIAPRETPKEAQPGEKPQREREGK